MVDALVGLFESPFAIGVMTLLSVIAASFAAYFAWRLYHYQRRRWFLEDARIMGVDIDFPYAAYTNQGWFHGSWRVYNRAPFPLKLISIEARSPKSLKIGTLDSSTQGPIEGMRVGLSGKSLTISRVVSIKDPPLRPAGYIHDSFFYKVSNTPDKDRGKTIRLRFLLCEADNLAHRYVKEIEKVIPMNTE